MSTNRWKNVFKEYKWVMLLLLLTVAVNTVEISEEYDKSELIRFHVLADNDSPQAQADKLAVKDAVAAFMQKELADSESAAESRAIIQKDMPVMQNIALGVLKERGVTDEKVEVVYGNFYFPLKYYGAFTLPAGEYEAVRIILGEGKGQNWWCVMFPPMCFIGASEDLGAYSDCVPKKEIVLKFKAVEWYEEHFGESEDYSP